MNKNTLEQTLQISEYLKKFNFFKESEISPELVSFGEYNFKEDAEEYCKKFEGLKGVTAYYSNSSWDDVDGHFPLFDVYVVVDPEEASLEELKNIFS